MPRTNLEMGNAQQKTVLGKLCKQQNRERFAKHAFKCCGRTTMQMFLWPQFGLNFWKV
jgi:hypothetical protein